LGLAARPRERQRNDPDGYWLLSDLLGVPNLSSQVRRVGAHVRDRLTRRSEARLPWPGWGSAAVIAYGAFTVVFVFFSCCGWPW
jgi:hypothetical protein